MELTERDLSLVLAVVKALDRPPDSAPDRAYKPGDKVFVRSVTHYYVGEVLIETPADIHLTKAAWIPDTGRFSNFLATGIPSECEPYPDGLVVRVPKGGIVDICDWRHDLLRAVK